MNNSKIEQFNYQELMEYNKTQEQALIEIYSQHTSDIKNSDFRSYSEDIHQLNIQYKNNSASIKYERAKYNLINQYLPKAKEYSQKFDELQIQKNQLDEAIRNNKKTIFDLFDENLQTINPYRYEQDEYRIKENQLNDIYLDKNSIEYKQALNDLSLYYKTLIETRHENLSNLFSSSIKTDNQIKTTIQQEVLSDSLQNAWIEEKTLLPFFHRVIETFRARRLKELNLNDARPGFRKAAIKSLLIALKEKALTFLKFETECQQFSKELWKIQNLLKTHDLDKNEEFQSIFAEMQQRVDFFSKVKNLESKTIQALQKVDHLIERLAAPECAIFLNQQDAQHILKLDQFGISMLAVDLTCIQDKRIDDILKDDILLSGIATSKIHLDKNLIDIIYTAKTSGQSSDAIAQLLNYINQVQLPLNEKTIAIILQALETKIELPVYTVALIRDAYTSLTHDEMMALLGYTDVSKFHDTYHQDLNADDFKMILALKQNMKHFTLKEETVVMLEKIRNNPHYGRAINRILSLFSTYNHEFNEHQVSDIHLEEIIKAVFDANLSEDIIQAYHHYTQHGDFAHSNCVLKARIHMLEFSESYRNNMQKKQHAIEIIYHKEEEALYIYDARAEDKRKILLNESQKRVIQKLLSEKDEVTFDKEQLNSFIKNTDLAPHLLTSVLAHYRVLLYIKKTPALQTILKDDTHIAEKIMFVKYLVGDWLDNPEKTQHATFDDFSPLDADAEHLLHLLSKTRDLPRAAKLFQEIGPIFSRMMAIKFDPLNDALYHKKHKALMKQIISILLSDNKDEMKCIKLGYIAEKHFAKDRNAFIAWFGQLFAKIKCTFSFSNETKRTQNISKCKETLFAVHENIVNIKKNLDEESRKNNTNHQPYIKTEISPPVEHVMGGK